MDGSNLITLLQSPVRRAPIGDEVLAHDPETGQASAKPVTAVIVGSGVKALTTITIRGPTGTDGTGTTGSVLATTGHPFWNADTRTWVDAADLTPGTTVLTADGEHATVLDVTNSARRQLAYNLTVADLHTYYVGAGDQDVLVHNCGTPKKLQTTPEATAAAKALGYTKVRQSTYPHGQAIYENKKEGLFISPDIDVHSGGTWKVAKKIEDLFSKKTRAGTANENLEIERP